MRFKVGDLVKIVKPNIKGKNEFEGAIRRIIKEDSSVSWILEDIKQWCWYENELELVEESTKPTEIKIDSNEIKLSAKPFKITTDGLHAQNTVNLVDQYEQFVLGKFNKKEGNKMIESMNLIDLYASKHKERIEKETKEKVEELRKNCDVINKYNELVEQFKKDCEELYLSQFTEEEKNEILTNQDIIDDSDMQLRRNSGYLYNYVVNKDFKSAEYYDTMNERNKKLAEIDDLIKTVKAHIGIAKTKEEVEEILDRYGIIKKGKLVTK